MMILKNKKLICAAVSTALGAVTLPQRASAELMDQLLNMSFEYEALFTMLDSTGAALENTSLPKGANRFQTPVTGTMTFNTLTMSGSGTVVPFDFFNNAPGLPAEAVGMNFDILDPISGDGSPTLVLGNMLFNWNGNNSIPVSIVLDAAGLFQGLSFAILQYNDPLGLLGEPVIMGVGSTPASDGTYVGAGVPGTVNGPNGNAGYLGLGPTPVVTTAWNTTSLCDRPGVANDGVCMGLSPSGGLPLEFDTANNPNDYIENDGGSIGGTPMIDGPFAGFNANFDITKLTLVDLEVLSSPSEIPVPAAAWLFGTGLLALVGVARRRRS